MENENANDVKPEQQELETENQIENSYQSNEIQHSHTDEKNSLSDSIVNIQSYEGDFKQNDPIQGGSESENSNLVESMVNIPPETENNCSNEDKLSQSLTDNNSKSEIKNDENSIMTDSIVNINSIPQESYSYQNNPEPEHSKKEDSEEKLAESMVNVENFDLQSRAADSLDNQMIESILDEVKKDKQENQLAESMVDVNSFEDNQKHQSPNSPPPPTDTTEIENDNQFNQNEDDITKSTVLLTESQILTEPCSEVEKISEQRAKNQENNLNTESMIVTNLSSESSSFVTSPVITDYVEDNKSKNDDENLDKEYEITDNIKNEIDVLSQEISSKLNEVRKNTQEDLKKALEKEPERNLENEKYENILGNGALLKKILKYGDSNIGRPTNGQMVTIGYEAYLKDNREKMVDHSDNLEFILGDGDVITAMDMIVSLMDKNELCEMITEARFAFGDLGKQSDIPPNADLVYKIELKDFRDLTALNQMSPLERLSLSEAKKMRGNYHFNRQDFHQATNSYKKGLVYFGEGNLRGDESETDLEKFLELSQALLMNTALAYYKLNELRQALENLEQVLKAQPNHIKGLYIRGKILLQMGESEEAVKSLSKAVQLDPNNGDVKKELTKAQAKHKIQYESEKKMYQKMISGVSKTGDTKRKTAKKNESSYTGFVVAGLAVAVASIGVALFARYKNML